jgi:tRNA(Ser,Leu) C12 N-acetylase TAN1
MTLLFFLKPKRQFYDRYISYQGERPYEQIKKKQRRRVYEVKRQSNFKIEVNELDATLEARKFLEKIMQQEFTFKLAQKRRKQEFDVLLISEMLDDLDSGINI